MNKLLKVVIVILVVAIIIGGCIWAYIFFTKDKDINNAVLPKYDTTAIFTTETYPRVDGSTATIPLSNAFKRAFTGDTTTKVDHKTTHYAYLNLIKGVADIILVTSPSEEEKELAKEKEVDLKVIPVVNEAFVFYVNENNPVKSLTVEQIQKIYSGEITNWKEVGGDDAEIIAYQREPNSGSQTGMLDLVMKNVKIMDAPKEMLIKDMASIVNLVSDYDNGKYSIGYSYYYYATTMYDDIDSEVTDRIRFVGVNGVEPKNETVIDGSYPFKTAYYIVVNNKDYEKTDSSVRKLVDAMLSDWGQDTAKSVGYIPLR